MDVAAEISGVSLANILCTCSAMRGVNVCVDACTGTPFLLVLQDEFARF